MVERATNVQPYLVGAAVDDVECGFDLVAVDRLWVVIAAGLVVPLLAIAIRTMIGSLITNPAAVLEDRPGIKIVAKIEKVAVDHFNAVVRVIDVAEQIRLRQHETFRRDLDRRTDH